jgi:hypothetical protein
MLKFGKVMRRDDTRNDIHQPQCNGPFPCSERTEISRCLYIAALLNHAPAWGSSDDDQEVIPNLLASILNIGIIYNGI